jgi:dTDP-4-amino-4,6-dideoxygalactose transaminase
MLAGFLLAQLERRAEIQGKRKRIWEGYAAALADWAGERGAQLPCVPEHCEPSYHMFYLVMRTAEERGALIRHLRERGVYSVFHYLPLNLSEMGRRWGGVEGQCPVTERVSDALLRLPFFYDLRDEEQARVIEGVLAFE